MHRKIGTELLTWQIIHHYHHHYYHKFVHHMIHIYRDNKSWKLLRGKLETVPGSDIAIWWAPSFKIPHADAVGCDTQTRCKGKQQKVHKVTQTDSKLRKHITFWYNFLNSHSQCWNLWEDQLLVMWHVKHINLKLQHKHQVRLEAITEKSQHLVQTLT